MAIELIGARNIWPAIRRAARGAKRRHVAVAYLGNDAPELLPLRAYDTLIVDLAERTVRQGSTSIRAAETFFRKRVHLCHAEFLHAKLFVFDDVTIVGSANASGHSADTLIEAAVQITDPRIAREARGYIESLPSQPITPAYLKLCRRWWNESRPDMQRFGRSVGRKSSTAAKGRVWLFASEPDDFDTRASDDKKAQAQIKNRREFIRQPLEWGRRPALSGLDLVVNAHEEDGILKVYPPGRFLGYGKSKQGDSLVYIELPRRPRLAREAEFRALVRRAFKLRSKRIPTRKIPSGWVHEFLALWAKGHSEVRAPR